VNEVPILYTLVHVVAEPDYLLFIVERYGAEVTVASESKTVHVYRKFVRK